MTDTVVDALIVDLLDWLASRDRRYEEVIDVWRISCPKLPVWENANERGFVVKQNVGGREIIKLTAAGFAFLKRRKTSPQKLNDPAPPDSPDFIS